MSDKDASVKIKVILRKYLFFFFLVLSGMGAGSENHDIRQTFEQA